MKKVDFNSGWYFTREGGKPEAVSLPHDAMQSERRDENAPAGAASGYYYGGVYTYTKTFTLTEEEIAGSLLLQFEGVYRNAQVTVNDIDISVPPYGYSPFFVDLQGSVHPGENTIVVVADNSAQPDSRWYTGGGIYRPVWLWQGPEEALKPECIRVSTLTYAPPVVRVDVDYSGSALVHIEILDGDTVLAMADGKTAEFTLPDAKLWSAQTPNLYTCKVTAGEDKAQTVFGIRIVEYGTDGLTVNGQKVLLKGGCLHHDHGILGARCFAESEERRVRILKQVGYNAIRSAHNPCSPALLEACDRLGMYLMDETWDMWYNHKNKSDYATDFPENYKADLQALVRRDFNHPSVILYSIANEISEPVTDKGLALEREIIEELHAADPSRPVTAGINLMILSMAASGKGIYKEEGGMNDAMTQKPKKSAKKQKASGSLLFNMITNMIGTNMNNMANGKKADSVTSPCLDALDIAGYNYASGRYPLEGKAHPNRIIFGSETFTQDIGKNWEMVEKYPYLIGDFMWTAWDYLGEAGAGAWSYDSNAKGFSKPYPWLLADAGAVDILGNPGAPAGYAAAVWQTDEKPGIYVQPVNHSHQPVFISTWRGSNGIASWSWQGCTGKKAIVDVFVPCGEQVRLEINGRPVGIKKVKLHKVQFKTKYTPGTIEAIALDASGKEISRSGLSTAQSSHKISLLPEGSATPGHVVYLPVNICDVNGVVESNADEKITIHVEGGELLAFGSANPCTTESYLSGSYTTYYGQALAVVRCGEETVTVTAKGETLPAVQVTL